MAYGSQDFHVHVYVHQQSDETLARIESMLKQVLKGVHTMTPEVSDLIAEVQATKDGEESARLMLDRIFTMLEANADNPATIRQAIDDLKAERDALAASVATDTPQSPPTPAPPTP